MMGPGRTDKEAAIAAWNRLSAAAKLADAVLRFCDDLDAAMERIRAGGFIATRSRVRTAAEAEYGEAY